MIRVVFSTFPTAASPNKTSFTLLLGLAAFAAAVVSLMMDVLRLIPIRQRIVYVVVSRDEVVVARVVGRGRS